METHTKIIMMCTSHQKSHLFDGDAVIYRVFLNTTSYVGIRRGSFMSQIWSPFVQRSIVPVSRLIERSIDCMWQRPTEWEGSGEEK